MSHFAAKLIPPPPPSTRLLFIFPALPFLSSSHKHPSTSSLMGLLPSTLVSFVSQSLQLMERWVPHWASRSPAPWRASRQLCRRPCRTRCPSTGLGRTWSGGGDATRVSGSRLTSPTMDLLKMVRLILAFLYQAQRLQTFRRDVKFWIGNLPTRKETKLLRKVPF